jgi:HAD superfamily hydrolase (TIGR01509 family)
MKLDLVIFDCDGVLVDSERLTVDVEARILTELGWAHTRAEVVERFMGRTIESQLAELEARLGPEKARSFDERSSAEIHASFERELVAVSGVLEVMASLSRSNVPVCVASSGSHAKMRRTLGLTGLLSHLEGRIFSASEVARGKPAPDLFLHAAARMGAEPARTAVIEDSVPGVRAAVAAGMTAYGFIGGLAAPGSLEAAGATVFAEMSDLVGLLDQSSTGNT